MDVYTGIILLIKLFLVILIAVLSYYFVLKILSSCYSLVKLTVQKQKSAKIIKSKHNECGTTPKLKVKLIETRNIGRISGPCEIYPSFICKFSIPTFFCAMLYDNQYGTYRLRCERAVSQLRVVDITWFRFATILLQ